MRFKQKVEMEAEYDPLNGLELVWDFNKSGGGDWNSMTLPHPHK